MIFRCGPVYIVQLKSISGIHDYTVCYALSKEYLARIEAPVKGFILFLFPPTAPCLKSLRSSGKSWRKTC